jgi:LuxR family maltose regulon positive regulatory protein
VAQVKHAAGHVATIRTYVATLRGEYAHAAEFARSALELLPEDDLATRGFAASQLAFALRSTDGLAAATEAAIEASAISRAAGDSHVAVMALCDLAGLQSLQGHLHEAADTYQDALRLTEEYAKRSGQQLPVAGFVYGRMSTILREWNDLEAAVHLARKGVELCKRWGRTELFVDCCFYLATVLQTAGDKDGALNAIHEAKQAARGLSPWYATVMELAEVRLQLALGDLASASRWAAAQDESSIRNKPYSEYVVRYLMLVRILIAQAWAHTDEGCDRVDSVWEDKLEKALKLLAELLQDAEEHCYTARAIEIQLRQALILQALGRVEQALPVLERVLAITESGGHVRIFVNKGALMGKLLRQAAARGIAVERVGQLLTAFKQAVFPLFSPLLIEPLSERETEVLRLIATGLSNREIAAELVLTVGTVKRHASNIYGKLNVHKRTQAVARARELGLL